MKKVFVSWIGEADILAERGHSGIARAIDARRFDQVHLLGNLDPERVIRRRDKEPIKIYTESCYKEFIDGLKSLTKKIELHCCKLKSPTNFGEVYKEALAVVQKIAAESPGKVEFTYHLSSGTAPMIAMWVIIAKTQHKGELVETKFPEHIRKLHPEDKHNVASVEVPFDITAEFLPDIIDKAGQEIVKTFIRPPGFEKVLGKSPEMREIIRRANMVASRGVPVLLEGESGTGKELIAEAIHKTSNRANKPFITVNCGAIPESLIESELFGYEKGAFTGATSGKPGLFEQANYGTIFLDEIGETDKGLQVKLLRAIQEKEIRRVGGNSIIKLDIRIIAATNRDLFHEIAQGRFREDLFYRLAVAVIKIPPLRERQGDIALLVDELFRQQSITLGMEKKKLSAEARTILLQHNWPGNVRELINTITSVIVWSERNTIEPIEINKVMLRRQVTSQDIILGRPLDGTPDFLDNTLDEVSRHYIVRALRETSGNVSLAAKLLGISNYQTFNYRCKKLGINGM